MTRNVDMFGGCVVLILALLWSPPAASTRGGYVNEGASLRLYENGLDLITQLVGQFVDPNPITGTVAGMEILSQSCLLDTLDVGLNTINYTVPIDARSLQLDFMPGNKLGGDVVLEATVTTSAWSSGCLINGTYPIHVHGLTGYVELTVGVVNHRIQVLSVDEFEIRDIWELEVDGGWIETVADIVGYDIEDEIEKMIKEEAKDLVEDQLVDMINDLLGEFVSLGLDFEGMEINIQPERFPIDDPGGTLFANAGVDAITVDPCVPTKVEPEFPGPSPGEPAIEYDGAFAAIGAGDGFQDDLLWAVWESGLLCFAETFDLGELLADIGVAGEANLNVRLENAPTMDIEETGGEITPTIYVEDLAVDLEMIVDGQPAGLLTISADAELAALVDITDDASLVLDVIGIELTDAEISYESETVPLEQEQVDALVDVLMPLYQEQIGALPLLDTILSFEGIFARILAAELVEETLVVYLQLAVKDENDDIPPVTTIDRIGGLNPHSQAAVLLFGTAPLPILYHGVDNLTIYDPFITYNWRVDGGPWQFAGYRQTAHVEGLSHGEHKFEVRATDFVGNEDPTGDEVTFEIDAEMPETQLLAGPPDFTNERIVEFQWTGSDPSGEPVTYQYRYSDGDWSPHFLGDSVVVAVPVAGPLEFNVRAVDSVGNPDPSPAIGLFTADFEPPTARFAATPGEWYTRENLLFELAADDDYCPLDLMLYRFRVLEGGGGSGHCNQDRWPDFELGATADFQGCRLSEGAHVFVAQAQDAAGNAETTQLEHHFTVDLTGPTTVITQDPGEEVTGSRATFEFAATDNYTPDAQLTFSWRIYPDGTGDGVEWSAPSTARVAVPVDLAPGRYEFAVRSFDLAGNTDEIPPTHVFDVYASTDKVPPVLEITSGPEGAWNQTSATFEWTATDDESPEARVLCGYRALPAMPAWSDPPAFVRTATLSDLVPGTDYRFEVRCEDESGNQSNASRRFRIELDAEAPDETEAPDEAETPVEAEQPPVEAEQPPVEIEQPPTETETPVEPDAEEAVIEPDAEAEVATEDTVDRPDQRPRNNDIPGDGGGCTCSTTPAPVGAEVLWLLLLIGWVVLRRRT